MSSVSESLPALRGRIAGLLGQLRALTESGPGGTLLATMSQEETGQNIAAIREGARGLAKAVEALQVELHEALAQAEQLEPTPARYDAERDERWTILKQALAEARGRSPEAALSVWLRSFAAALAEWRLDVCERMTGDEMWSGTDSKEIRETLRETAIALRGGNHVDALPGVMLLADPHPAGLATTPIDGESRVAMLVLQGRIRLQSSRDHAAALDCFEKAREMAPQNGVVQEALAEYHRAKGDDALARDLYRQEISASPDRPGGYVGMGLWCEAQQWWDKAEDWYRRAIDTVLGRAANRDPLTEFGQLLAPTSGALYLRFARSLRAVNPASALAVVDEALRLGIQGPGKYPARPAYELKGEILSDLRRAPEAADAFLQAGRYYIWERLWAESLPLIERAHELAPEKIETLWNWSDALLATSYLPKSPFVDPEKVQQSLEVWNRAVRIATPGVEHAWAYLTRSQIAQQLANVPHEDRWERTWEAAVFAEQSLLLNPTRGLAWVFLAQVHYATGNDVTALHAGDTALLCDSEDVSVVEECIFLLTNLYRYTEARELLSKRSAMKPPAPDMVAAVEAHILLYEAERDPEPRAYAAALLASDKAIAAGSTAVWVRIDRAVILRRTGRVPEARQIYQEIWRSFDEADVDRQLSYAWAALMIGELDVASKILAGRSGDRICGATSVERYLGFYHLLRGECPAARQRFDASLAKAMTARDLDAWLIGDAESPEILWLLEGRPYLEEARRILHEYQAAALRKRTAQSPPRTALDEMTRLASQLAPFDEAASWNVVGVNATAARLNLEAGACEKAGEIYEALERTRERFHAAPEGRRQARQCQSAGLSGGDGLALDAHLELIREQRADLERRRCLIRRFGAKGIQRLPAVTPVAIEAAGNLRRLLGTEDRLDESFERHLDDMRLAGDYLLGFKAPPVRVRINESDLPDGTYIFMINEVPIVSGSIELDKGLCNATVDRLTLLGVKGEEAINPANGSECSWIREADWPKVKDKGLVIWTPAEYVVLHLFALIRKNPIDLVGIQAVATLLKERASERLEEILAAKGGLPRFTSVVQALLADGVSIKSLSRICDCYLTHQELPTYEIPEEVRCLDEIRQVVPGNESGTPIYRLGDRLVSLIAGGIRREGETAVLALEPEPTQEALTAIRNEVSNLPPVAKNPVLFVEDWHMRSFVRRLVELEFPYLMVLSRREALGADERSVIATIDIEAPRARKL